MVPPQAIGTYLRSIASPAPRIDDAPPILPGANEHDRVFLARTISHHERALATGRDERLEAELKALRAMAVRVGVAPPGEPADLDPIRLATLELANGGDRRVRGLARRMLAARRRADPPR